MRIAKKIIILLTVIISIISERYSFAEVLNDDSWTAEAWNELEGRLHDKVSLDYYNTENNVNYSHVSAGNHIEFDLTESVTIYNSIYYKYLREEYSYPVYDFLSTDGSNKVVRRKGSAYGLDDIDAGLKHRLLDGEYGILSHKVNISIPGPYDENDAFPLGNGKYKVDYRILYGYSLSRLYLNLSAGYRWRSGDLTDQAHYSAAIVGKITPDILIRAKLDGTLRIIDSQDDNAVYTNSGPAVERVSKNTAGINIPDIKYACGGDGAGYNSDTSLSSTTEERLNTNTVSFGLLIKLTGRIGLNFSYKPMIHTRYIDEDLSYSVGISCQLI